MRYKWKLVLVRLETVLTLTQDRCTVCGKHTMALNSFWMHQTVLLGDEAQVEARFGLFGDSANLDRMWWTVCTEHTIGSKIILDAPD